MPYRIHPAFKATATFSEPVPVTVTPLNDRILNAEASFGYCDSMTILEIS
jgi:hypothetical protein